MKTAVTKQRGPPVALSAISGRVITRPITRHMERLDRFVAMLVAPSQTSELDHEKVERIIGEYLASTRAQTT
jgi:hypothetical protein